MPAGIVLTGGGASLSHMAEFAKDKFRLPVRTGKPRGISGLEPDLSFAVCCGLVLQGVDPQMRKESYNPGEGILSKIKNIFRIFIP